MFPHTLRQQILKGYIQYVFQKYDTDHRGVLNLKKLTLFFRDLFRALNISTEIREENVLAAIGTMDKNGDGLIDQKQLFDAFHLILAKQTNPQLQPKYQNYQQISTSLSHQRNQFHQYLQTEHQNELYQPNTGFSNQNNINNYKNSNNNTHKVFKDNNIYSMNNKNNNNNNSNNNNKNEKNKNNNNNRSFTSNHNTPHTTPNIKDINSIPISNNNASISKNLNPNPLNSNRFFIEMNDSTRQEIMNINTNNAKKNDSITIDNNKPYLLYNQQIPYSRPPAGGGWGKSSK